MGKRPVQRKGNVLVVDFRGGGPEPPVPRFPGAGALRNGKVNTCEMSSVAAVMKNAA